MNLSEFADVLEKEKDAFVHENFMQDPETGAWEGGTRAQTDWLEEREELIERMRSLNKTGNQFAFDQATVEKGSVKFATQAVEQARKGADEKSILLTQDVIMMIFTQSAITFEIGMRCAAQLIKAGVYTSEQIADFFDAKWPKETKPENPPV